MAAILAVLAFAHAVLVILLPFSNEEVIGLIRLFDMGQEANLPTYWSALALLAAGILLLLIARAARRLERPFVRHWTLLGLGFIYLSVDEAAQLHEGVVALAWLHFFEPGDGIWHYVWIIPAIAAVSVVLLAYIPFLLHLPRRYAAMFIMAAALFLGGSIGMEMVEATLDFRGRASLMHVSRLVEETLEIAGVTWFVYALLTYASDRRLGTTIAYGGRLPAPSAGGPRPPTRTRPLRASRSGKVPGRQ